MCNTLVSNMSFAGLPSLVQVDEMADVRGAAAANSRVVDLSHPRGTSTNDVNRSETVLIAGGLSGAATAATAPLVVLEPEPRTPADGEQTHRL